MLDILANYISCVWVVIPKKESTLVLSNEKRLLKLCNMNKVAKASIKWNKLDILIWTKKKETWGKIFYTNSTYSGYLYSLKWLKSGDVININIYYIAARYGNIRVLKWLYDSGQIWHGNIDHISVGNGYCQNLKWLRLRGYWLKANICNIAANNGHKNVFEWLIKKGYLCNRYICNDAVYYERFKILELLLSKGYSVIDE